MSNDSQSDANDAEALRAQLRAAGGGDAHADDGAVDDGAVGDSTAGDGTAEGKREQGSEVVRAVVESVGFKLDDLVREHHEKYDSRVELPNKAAGGKPSRYYQDVAARAKKFGMSIAAMREQDDQVLANSRFPSPQCLKPDQVLEIAGWMAGKLSGDDVARFDEARAHVDDCLYCQLVVASSEPDDATVDRFIERMKRKSEPVAQSVVLPHRRTSMMDKLKSVIAPASPRRAGRGAAVIAWSKAASIVAILAICVGLLSPPIAMRFAEVSGLILFPSESVEEDTAPVNTPAPASQRSQVAGGAGSATPLEKPSGGATAVATTGTSGTSAEAQTETKVIGLYLRGIAKSVATSPVHGMCDFSLATRLSADNNTPYLHAPPMPVDAGGGDGRSPNMQSYEVYLDYDIDLITPGTGTRTLIMRPDLNMRPESDEDPKNEFQGDSPAIGAAPRPAGTAGAARSRAATGAAPAPANSEAAPGSPR